MTPPKFYQGQTLYGPVAASDAQTFAEVVELLKFAPKLGIERKAFFALPEAKRNEMKQVPFFVPACFKQSPSPRTLEHATHCNLLFLDIDPEKENRNGQWVETGRFPAAPFVANHGNLHSALKGFNFAAHTTASSTPEKPRMRIVVEAHQIPIADYARAVRTVGEMLGLGKVTPESKKAAQPMFFPVVFMDDPADYHPMMAEATNGRAFTVADISENLTDEYNKPLRSNGNDDLDFLRAQVPEITLSIAKEALAKINAGMNRIDWHKIAAALRHQFSPHEAEEAYQLFDEWSSTGHNYAGSDDTQKMWDSLRPTPIGRAPITIHSLLQKATQSGWDGSKVRQQGFDRIAIWMEQCANATELIEAGAKKILSTPMLSSSQERMLVERMKSEARARFGEKVSVTDIREDLDRQRKAIREQEKKDGTIEIPWWVKGVVYVSNTQRFFRQRTGESYPTKSWDETYSCEHLDEATSPSQYCLEILKIPRVYAESYNAAEPNKIIFVKDERRFVNTYVPAYPELDPTRAAEAGRLFQLHLTNLVAELEYRKTFTDFLAYMVQHPGKKIRWAVFIQSAEGAGKTFLAEVMKAVLGKRHVRTISGETIKKGWNEWSAGSQLVVLEEIRVIGANRHEIMNVLKPLITNDDISIDQRNRDTRDAENCANYLIFSNFTDAIPITESNRRYFILKSPLQSFPQVQKLNDNGKYFPPLYAMLRDFPGGLRAWLNDWKISADFRPDGPPPKTVYEREMAHDTASEAQSAVHSLIMDGDDPLIQYDIVSSYAVKNHLQLERLKVSNQELGRVLRDEGLHSVGRHMITGERQNLWVRNGLSGEEAAETARERQAKGLKNLCKEIEF